MSQQAYWKVKLYDRQDSSSPLVEFIKGQSKRDQAKILAELDDLAEFGLMPRGNKLKHIEGKLWELRFRGENLHFRFVYFAYTGTIPSPKSQIAILDTICSGFDAKPTTTYRA